MIYKNNEDGVRMFSASMRLFLEKHEEEKEDSWVQCDINYLESALLQEIEEYKEALDHNHKSKELIDIANMCMMLYHRHIEENNKEEDNRKNIQHIPNIFFVRKDDCSFPRV